MNSIAKKSGGFLGAAIVAVLFAFPPETLAQPAPAPQIQPVGRYSPAPTEKVADIEIRSPGGINRADVSKLLDVRKGDQFSIMRVRSSVKLLYQTGLFSDIAVYSVRRADGVVLVFELVPRLRVNNIKISGNVHISELDVIRTIRVDKHDEFVPQNVTQMEMDLRKVLEKAGFKSAKVNIGAKQVPGTIKVDLEVNIEEGPPVRISDVKFEGHPHFSPVYLMDETGLKPGQILDMNSIDKNVAWMKKFYRDKGFVFASIQAPQVRASPDGKTAELAIPVECGERVDIFFDAPKGVPVRGLRKVIGRSLEDREGADIDYLLDQLKTHMISIGFPFSDVKARVIKGDKEKTDKLIFVVRSGPQVLVSDIRFIGNMGVPHEKLRNAVEAFADEYKPSQSIFDPVRLDEPDSGAFDFSQGYRESPDLAPPFENDPERVFVQDKFDRASQTVADLYKSMGFLDVKVSKPELSFSPDNKRVLLTYRVEEGPQTFIKSIRFKGNVSLSNYYLSYQLKSLFSSYLNMFEVEEARLKIQQLYAEQGFAYVTVADDLIFSADRADVDVVYNIEEGRQVKVDRIVLQGNDITHDSIVLGNLNFKPGDLYKPSSMTKSQSNLLKLQAFQGASVAMLDPDEMASLKDVGVFLKERDPQVFLISGGLSTEDGVRVSGEYGHLNLFGRALEFKARLKLSYQVFAYVPGMMNADVAEQFRDLPWYDAIAREANVSLGVPRIYQLPFNMSARLDLVNERINERVYFEDRTAVTPGIEMQLADPLTFLLSYTFEYDFITRSKAVVPNTALTIQEQQLLMSPQGLLWLGTIRPTFVLDYRDDKFNPHSGFMFKVAMEYTRSLSKPKSHERIIMDPFDPTQWVSAVVADPVVNFVKLYGYMSFYIPTSKLTTLALQVAGGNIFLLGDDAVTTANSVFYMGGRATLRGFQESAMFPGDIDPRMKHTSSGGAALSPGGNTYILYKAEFRFPLLAGFEAGIFLEAGNLFLNPQNFTPFKDLRPCAGFGIRYRTPVGPLAVDVGFNLLPDNTVHEPAAALQFSVGLF